MSARGANRWPAARLTTLAGLIAGAAGILLLKAAGTAMPLVPPGFVLLAVAAVLVILVGTRWTLVVAAVVGLLEVIGTVASGSLDGLTSGDPLVVVATLVRGLGVLAALIAGVVASAARRPPQAAADDREEASIR